jgi:hypothetical protein
MREKARPTGASSLRLPSSSQKKTDKIGLNLLRAQRGKMMGSGLNSPQL